jgi:hypothetical protein
VTLLHSFWYVEAAQGLTVVTNTDPTCAKEGSDIAMSLWYPLCQPPDVAVQLYHRYQIYKRLGSTFAPPPLSPHACLPTRSWR